MNLYPASGVLFTGQLTCSQRNLWSYRVCLYSTISGILVFFEPQLFFLSCSFYREDFCPVLSLFSVFLVSSEDADSLRIHTLSATGDIESIQKMVDDLDIEQGPSSSS